MCMYNLCNVASLYGFYTSIPFVSCILLFVESPVFAVAIGDRECSWRQRSTRDYTGAYEPQYSTLFGTAFDGINGHIVRECLRHGLPPLYNVLGVVCADRLKRRAR